MAIFRSIFNIVGAILIWTLVVKGDDAAWYRSMLSEKVAPPYVAAYQTLLNKISNPLYQLGQEMASQNGTNVTTVVSTALSVTCGTKELNDNLRVALNASDDLNNQLEKKLSDLISAVSQKENEIRQVNNQLNAVRAQIAHSEGQVNNAQNDVNNKQNELDQANAQLAEEQRKLDNARHCGKRKKRFWGSVWRRIIRPFCAVFNYGGINRAKDRRGNAQGAVNSAREQLANFQRQLDQQRNQLTNFQNQQTQINGRLNSLSAQLTQLQARQIVLANITINMRNVIQHLSSFVSKVSVLYDELQDLVSFELLIAPLNEILTELIENGVTVDNIAGITQISSTDIDVIQSTIATLKTELPTLPLLDGYPTTC